MRGLAIWLVAGFLAMVCQAASTRPAIAQIGDAQAAFNSAVRQAQRMFATKPKRRRRHKGLRATIHANTKYDRATHAPLPGRNPKRRTISKASRHKNTTPVAVSQSSPNADKRATKPSAKKQKPAEVPPVKPDVWSAKEIDVALRACRKALRSANAKVIPVGPIKRGPCGDPAPVKLARLGGAVPVVFSPPPVVNCKMVGALARWLRNDLQPLAKKHLGAAITKVSVMSSYSCRNAYGRKKTRLSEHGLANALDIGGFITKDGARTDLLAHWGPTQRDIIAAAQKAQAENAKAYQSKSNPGSTASTTSRRTDQGKTASPSTPDVAVAPAVRRNARTRQRKQKFAHRSLPDAQDGTDPLQQWYRNPTPQPSSNTRQRAAVVARPVVTPSVGAPPVPERRPSLRQRMEWAKAAQQRAAKARKRNRGTAYRDQLNNFLSYRNDLGGPKHDRPTKAARSAKRVINRAAFLRGAHRTACRIFGTVLGPEANDAHRNHFHVDLAPRKRSNYCR